MGEMMSAAPASAHDAHVVLCSSTQGSQSRPNVAAGSARYILWVAMLRLAQVLAAHQLSRDKPSVS